MSPDDPVRLIFRSLTDLDRRERAIYFAPGAFSHDFHRDMRVLYHPPQYSAPREKMMTLLSYPWNALDGEEPTDTLFLPTMTEDDVRRNVQYDDLRRNLP